MKFGFFNDKDREYVITTPKTPYPWINYLGTDDFFSLVSNTGGGYSFYKDARLRRITRYRYNNMPIDDNGKYFYIKDGDTVWNPGWKPTKTELDSYSCAHGMGYTRIEGEKNNVKATTTAFVPMGIHGEAIKVSIKNNGKGKKSLKLFSFVEFALWNALDDMTNFQRNFSTGEVEVVDSTIFNKTEYRERRNHFSFFSVNEKIDGFDTDRESFVGLYNSLGEAEVVSEGKSKNSIAHGWSPIASHYIKVELEEGEEKEFVFLLGYVENHEEDKLDLDGEMNKSKAFEMIESLNTPAKFDQKFEEYRKNWDNLLSKYQVESGDEKLDRMVNIWNQYQCMVTFNMSRSASYFESGIGRGMGFRDSNQDIIGFVHQIPEKARERILDLAATQLEDGGAFHQYQPLTKKGNNDVGGNFNDDPLWLILSTTAYIKETGDWTILDESVPYENDPHKAESLFDHLHRSFNHVVHNLGPHRLPLIGRADWNDCLNLNCFSNVPDEPFQTTENQSGGTAESVMIAGMFVLYGKEFVRLCEYLGKDELVKEARTHVDSMVLNIDKYGWDGEWFLRAYDFYGEKVGSDENEEGKIFIESQGFCTMAGVGLENGNAVKALNSVKKHLDSEYGIVLNFPAYTKYHINLGEISTYPEGYKENGGIFCHNNPWVIIGETVVGNGDRAWEYYKKIAPAYLEDISEIHRTEPYVYSQMIAGKQAFKPGEAKNSWLTGTAAWNFYTISQHILGIKPDYDGLIIDPVIPSSLKEYKIVRKFRNNTYKITIKNPQGKNKGVKSVIVDGKNIGSNMLPNFNDGKEHTVIVEIG